MHDWGFNRTLGQAPILMSLIALGLVVFGESIDQTVTLSAKNSAALFFQVLIFSQPLLIVGFLISAGWRRPLRTAIFLLLQGSALGLVLAISWHFERGSA